MNVLGATQPMVLTAGDRVNVRMRTHDGREIAVARGIPAPSNPGRQLSHHLPLWRLVR